MAGYPDIFMEAALPQATGLDIRPAVPRLQVDLERDDPMDAMNRIADHRRSLREMAHSPDATPDLVDEIRVEMTRLDEWHVLARARWKKANPDRELASRMSRDDPLLDWSAPGDRAARLALHRDRMSFVSPHPDRSPRLVVREIEEPRPRLTVREMKPR